MDDLELAQSAAKGNREAFRLIFTRHSDVVFRISLKYTGGDRPMAQDMVQKTFIRVFEALSSFGPPYNLRAWICSIANNTGIDFVREKNRERSARLDYGEFLPGAPENPEEILLKNECRDIIRSALDAEPDPSCRETARLFYEQDLSTLEISSKLNVSRTAVTSRLSRFRGRLMKLVARHYLEG